MGANYTITILRADGTTGATILVTAPSGGDVTAMFWTVGFPLGRVTATIGPAGSSSLLGVAMG